MYLEGTFVTFVCESRSALPRWGSGSIGSGKWMVPLHSFEWVEKK